MENYDIANLDFKIPTIDELILSRLTENSLHELRCFSNSFREMSSLEYSMEIELRDYELIWTLLKKKGFFLNEGKSFQNIKELQVSLERF